MFHLTHLVRANFRMHPLGAFPLTHQTRTQGEVVRGQAVQGGRVDDLPVRAGKNTVDPMAGLVRRESGLRVAGRCGSVRVVGNQRG
jgi:hypothetical protein